MFSSSFRSDDGSVWFTIYESIAFLKYDCAYSLTSLYLELLQVLECNLVYQVRVSIP